MESMPAGSPIAGQSGPELVCPHCEAYGPHPVYVNGPHKQCDCTFCAKYIKNLGRRDVHPVVTKDLGMSTAELFNESERLRMRARELNVVDQPEGDKEEATFVAAFMGAYMGTSDESQTPAADAKSAASLAQIALSAWKAGR